ncbi:envelope glycoprotein N [Colobine gammaherpesvirus 1]|uniref:Envelope glycoprotein N n=1 Tax=Colobine gammaherpesvirus 1 TaxID=2597325 RepID=A0A5B8G5F0_9GAMA|nr:envelope glycoprotein N [Colobine gammaherpesvirus 1]QDQ69260.1 envelope glycoprotein N [Colobine gammaherpesvirus 1]
MDLPLAAAILCLVVVAGHADGTDAYTRAVTPTSTTPTTPGFYDTSCTAETFSPTLSSFSSIWALINAFIVLVATFFYLVYLCFFKFVDEMVRK